MMKVLELIEKLKQYPQQAQIFTLGKCDVGEDKRAAKYLYAEIPTANGIIAIYVAAEEIEIKEKQ